VSGFPEDEYTPHGYLANPYAVAHSWSEGDGGSLRSSREHVGFGWLLPWPQWSRVVVDLIVVLRRGAETLVTRADFAEHGLHAPHHASRLFVYRWQAFGRTWEASYTLVGRDRLGLSVTWTAPSSSVTLDMPGGSHGERSTDTVSLGFVLQATYRPGKDQPSSSIETLSVRDRGDLVGWAVLPDDFGRFELHVSERDRCSDWTTSQLDALLVGAGTASADDRASRAAFGVTRTIAEPGAGAAHALLVRRPPATREPATITDDLPATIADAVATARADDDRFWSGAARLAGDWPAAWRRGWVYDLDTTRMCIHPAGGIFNDVWPAWMIQWPRAVVAEGTLDTVRLAYGDSDLAKRAVLSLFRDAPAANVPCVFQHGEPNMVAADGSVCGTSPAWCVPFYNLERLFALTLDVTWLAELYPHLTRYVDWWLSQRVDADGWGVYKCTWEAGEDDNPRLDPERRGDNVVSSFVRPVELQATMALSAGVLARFATVLGRKADIGRWRTVESEYAARTRRLWDDAEGRFRDWDAQRDRFLEPAGEPNYWGVDPCRYSALAFTPILAGLASEAQQRRLHDEMEHYASPPWTLWASWSYVVLEAALLSNARAFASRVAHDIVSRVYPELDERRIASDRHPTPGVAREYWPLDLATWESCEGYGWGANTASLLIRQIFGFLEGPYLDVPSTPGPAPLQFRIWPGLPAALCEPGRGYGVENLPYRGHSLSIVYRIRGRVPEGDLPATPLTISITADVPTSCRVIDRSARVCFESAAPALTHVFDAQNGDLYDVSIAPVP